MLAWFSSLPGAAAQGIIWGLMAVGVYITYKILDFADLTVDGSYCTGAAICAVLVTNGVNVYLAMAVAFIGGALTGLVTGLFHTKMGIPAILAGIITQLMLWSVNLKIMGRSNIAVSARTYNLPVAALNVPKTLFTLALVSAAVVAVLYWFFGTEIGAALRATGCNRKMSRAQGINTRTAQVIGLMMSNGFVALAGGLLCQYQGNADINMGRGAIVIGLAAVVIGDAVFSKINRNFAVRLVGVIAGGVIYSFVYQTVVFLGLDAELLKMLSALVVAVFLAVPYWKKKIMAQKVGKTSEKGE